MNDKIVDFKQAVAEAAHEIKPFPAVEKEDINEKRRNAIKKLGQYRGEVQSKNTIRDLPDVKVGEIFWVAMDNKAYIVAKKDKKKMTIKALDETASISTGITVYDMNKSIVSKEPIFDWSDTDAVNKLNERIHEWFNTNTSDQHYLMYGRDIHYVTLFNVTARAQDKLVEADVAKLLRETLAAIGDVISFDFNTTEGQMNIEIWIRTKDSAAEMLYLFPYDNGIVSI